MTFICLKTVLFPDSPAPRSRSLIFSASLFAWQARLCSISLASFFLSCSSGPSLLAVQPILLSKHLGPFLTYLIRSGLLALMNFVATECGHSWALELSLSQRCIGGYFRLGRYTVLKNEARPQSILFRTFTFPTTSSLFLFFASKFNFFTVTLHASESVWCEKWVKTVCRNTLSTTHKWSGKSWVILCADLELFIMYELMGKRAPYKS